MGKGRPVEPIGKLLQQAIRLAVNVHNNQEDKNGQPYILHPLRVMNRFWTNGQLSAEMVVAVLHDVVEDCAVPLDNIRALFGPEIGAAIDAITRRDGESYEKYIERCALNPVARRVKIADIADNVLPERYVEGLKLPKRYGKAVQFLQAAEG